jgi:hypothetical protein
MADRLAAALADRYQLAHELGQGGMATASGRSCYWTIRGPCCFFVMCGNSVDVQK